MIDMMSNSTLEIKVTLADRSQYDGKEKQVDTRLSVDATKDLIKLKDKAGKHKTIILFTGMI